MKQYILAPDLPCPTFDYLLWGARGHGKVCREVLDHQYSCKAIALFDNDDNVSSPYSDLNVQKGSELDLWSIGRNEIGFIVAIGGGNGQIRIELSQSLENHGLIPISFIHPKAIVSSDFNIPLGLQMMAGSNIGPNVTIGDYTIINHLSNVDHDCTIGKGCHIAPGATLCGEVTVSDYVFVGSGSVVLPRIKIGENSIIGAGSVVTKDVPSDTTVVGNPARYLKNTSVT